MGFPIEADIIEQVKKVAGGEEAQKVTTSHPPVDMKESVVFLLLFFQLFKMAQICSKTQDYKMKPLGKGMLWIILLSVLIFNYRSILAAIKSYF